MGTEERNNTEEVEIWKDIPGYEGLYQVGDLGNVRGLPRIAYSGEYYNIVNNYPLRMMIQRIRSEYPSVTLCIGGIGKAYHVHRLVGNAHVPNPDPSNNKWLNHKDGDKLNARASNLEWCTISQNVRHAIDTGLIVNPEKNFSIISRPLSLNGNSSKVKQIDLSGRLIREWACIKEAANAVGCSSKAIQDVAKNCQNTAGGFKWQYSFRRQSNSKLNNNKVLQFTMDGILTKEWGSVSVAAQYLGISCKSISRSCSGKRKSGAGFIWKFKD